MDVTLNLDPPVNLSFGTLTTDDLLDLRTEIEASGILDPEFTSIARTVHAAATQRSRACESHGRIVGLPPSRSSFPG